MDRAAEAAILERLTAATRAAIASLEIFDELESTNAYLLATGRPAGESLAVAIAQRQTAGRGRHGRYWHSAPGAGLWLSVAGTLAAMPASAAAMTLAFGAAVARAIERLGVTGLGLKWPNDLVACERKLGGILVESSLRRGAGATVVCGLGLNTCLPADIGEHAGDLAPIGLDELRGAATRPVDLAAPMIEALHAGFDAARADALGALLADWRRYDHMRGRPVRVEDAGGRRLDGIAAGIDDDGALLVTSGGSVHRVVSGTVRPLAAAA